MHLPSERQGAVPVPEPGRDAFTRFTRGTHTSIGWGSRNTHARRHIFHRFALTSSIRLGRGMLATTQ